MRKTPDLLASDVGEDHRRRLREWLDGRERPFEVLLERQYGGDWHVRSSYSYKRENAAWNRYTRLMIWAHANANVTPKLVRDFVGYQRDGGEFDFEMYVDTIKEQEQDSMEMSRLQGMDDCPVDGCTGIVLVVDGDRFRCSSGHSAEFKDGKVVFPEPPRPKSRKGYSRFSG